MEKIVALMYGSSIAWQLIVLYVRKYEDYGFSMSRAFRMVGFV
jgi:hypothetical protein